MEYEDVVRRRRMMRRTRQIAFVASTVLIVLLLGVGLILRFRGERDVLESDQILLLEAGHVYQLAWSPDGQTLAVAGGNRLQLVDLDAFDAAPKILTEWETSTLRHVAFSPDGTFLAVYGEEGTVEVWSMPEGLHTLTLVGVETLSPVHIDSGSTRIAAAGGEGVLIWDAKTGDLIQTITTHEAVLDLDISPDGQTIATTHCAGEFPECEASAIFMWDADSGELRDMLENENPVVKVIFNPAGRYLLGISPSSPAELWNLGEGRIVRRYETIGIATNAVAFISGGRFVATGGLNGDIELWNVESGQEIAEVRAHDNIIRSLAFSPDYTDGNQLASISEDGDLILWAVNFYGP